jgi:hypothetical protein
VTATDSASAADAGSRQQIFRLVEYAGAERACIGGTLDALARARDPLLSRIPIERTSRAQTTQITTDTGSVVEHQPVELRSSFSQRPDDIIEGRLDDLFASLDQAAEQYAEQFGKQFYEFMSRVTDATGNVVDAKDRPFFDSIYEMFEKIDLQFDAEGRIQQELHLNPADVEKWKKGWEALTPQQHERLNALIDRKRQEFNARRRDRRIPRRGN